MSRWRSLSDPDGLVLSPKPEARRCPLVPTFRVSQNGGEFLSVKGKVMAKSKKLKRPMYMLTLLPNLAATQSLTNSSPMQHGFDAPSAILGSYV